eukprot:Awhi_evm1s14925
MGNSFSSPPINLLLLGLEGSGKTTILQYLIDGTIVEIVPMVTSGFTEREFENYKIRDVSGSCKRHSLLSECSKNVQGLIYVVDSTDRERLEASKQALKNYINSEDADANMPILIFLNKQDLANAVNIREVIDIFKLQDYNDPLLPSRNWSIQSCSCITGEGFKEGFAWLGKAL